MLLLETYYPQCNKRNYLLITCFTNKFIPIFLEEHFLILSIQSNVTPANFCYEHGGFIAQLVEHCTGIEEVTGLNHVEALIFFRLLLSNCLSWKIYLDDHSSLSPTTAVQTVENWFVPSARISSYGCTREVWRARKEPKSCWRR